MEISSRALRKAAEFLEVDAGRVCPPEDLSMLENVAEYLRYVANQREEFEARKREEDPRMKKLRGALAQVWSARRAAVNGRA